MLCPCHSLKLRRTTLVSHFALEMLHSPHADTSHSIRGPCSFPLQIMSRSIHDFLQDNPLALDHLFKYPIHQFVGLQLPRDSRTAPHNKTTPNSNFSHMLLVPTKGDEDSYSIVANIHHNRSTATSMLQDDLNYKILEQSVTYVLTIALSFSLFSQFSSPQSNRLHR